MVLKLWGLGLNNNKIKLNNNQIMPSIYHLCRSQRVTLLIPLVLEPVSSPYCLIF
jgi:hypothetical protein